MVTKSSAEGNQGAFHSKGFSFSMTAFHNILIKSLVGKLKKKQIFFADCGAHLQQQLK